MDENPYKAPLAEQHSPKTPKRSRVAWSIVATFAAVAAFIVFALVVAAIATPLIVDIRENPGY